MLFLVEALVLIATVFLQKALAPRPNTPHPGAATTSSIGPQCALGIPIPVVFGTCKISNPNLLWYKIKSTRIARDANGNPLGIEYWMLMDVGLCYGLLDTVVSMRVNDTDVQWSNASSSALYSSDGVGYRIVYVPNAMGGDGYEGGVTGEARAYLGSLTQPVDTLMAAEISSYPGMAGFSHVVLSIGGWRTPVIPPVEFVVQRCPNTLGLTSGHHQITSTWTNPVTGVVTTVYDANPAAMVYEILTNTTWGLGMDPALIDSTSFLAAGDELFTEGFGLSMVLEQSGTAADYIREILRHIDGGLTTDTHTGKLILQLIRGGYTVGSLPVLDQSCIGSVSMTRGSWLETTNVAQITFVSAADNFTDRIVQWQDLSNVQATGVSTVVQATYRGCSNSHTASLVAARVCKLGSYPFAKLTLKVNRKAWALRQCDLFVLNWPPLGISGMVVRVTKPATGKLEAGEMTIEGVEDAFAIANTAYSELGPTGWVNPADLPVPIVHQRIIEPPICLMINYTGGTYAGGAAVFSLVANPSPVVTGFDVWRLAPDSDQYQSLGAGVDFTPFGTLGADYPANTAYVDSTGFAVGILSGQTDIDGSSTQVFTNVTFKGFVLVDDEIMGYTGISGTGAQRQLTGVWRGLFDTVPADHDANADVWFLGLTGIPLVTLPYSDDSVWGQAFLTIKMLSKNSGATLPLDFATALSLQLSLRTAQPQPPGNVKVGGVSWPTTFAHGTDRAVTWAKRNPYGWLHTVGDYCVPQSDGDWNDTSNNNVYQVEVRIEGVLKRTMTYANVNTWTWTAAMQATDCGSIYNKQVSIRILTQNWNNVYSGKFYQERVFTIT